MISQTPLGVPRLKFSVSSLRLLAPGYRRNHYHLNLFLLFFYQGRVNFLLKWKGYEERTWEPTQCVEIKKKNSSEKFHFFLIPLVNSLFQHLLVRKKEIINKKAIQEVQSGLCSRREGGGGKSRR